MKRKMYTKKELKILQRAFNHMEKFKDREVFKRLTCLQLSKCALLMTQAIQILTKDTGND